jgi:glyoxylase-like metal-dependent hydrolase (beta-lactamase superfamily II)
MRRLLVFLAAIAAGAAAANGQPAPGPYGPLVGRTLAPGIHLLGTPEDYRGAAIGNIVVIEQSDGVVMIDSGGTVADGRRAVAFVRSITEKPVKALVISHWHNDHPLGVSALRDAWPKLRIIATPATRRGLLGPAAEYVGLAPDERYDTMNLNQISEALTQLATLQRNPANDEATRQRYARLIRTLEDRKADLAGTYLVLPNETFIRELLLDDPVRPILLMFLGRANTEGDAVAWLPKDRVVATGDIVVSPLPFGFYSFPGEWIEVLGKLKALDYRLLIPGHGEPQADTAYLDRLIGTLTDVRAQVGPLARQGMTLEQVRTKVDFRSRRACSPTRRGRKRPSRAIGWSP